METDAELQEQINAVPLSCVICSGDDSLKREIFRHINTLGVPLSDFEVLNGLFAGEYLRGLTTFVKGDKSAIKVLGEASRGKRQMKALGMLVRLAGNKRTNDNINMYVAQRRDESFQKDQRTLKKYLDFIAAVFDDMALLEVWFDLAQGNLQNKAAWAKHKKAINKQVRDYKRSDAWKLQSAAARAQDVKDIVAAATGGITLDPRRLFTTDQKAELLAKQDSHEGLYRCEECGEWFYPDELEMDHVKPWSKGGRTELSNAQLLCRACNNTKGSA